MSDAIVDGRFDFPEDSAVVREFVKRGRRPPSTPEDWHLYTGSFVPAEYDASFELPRAELERCAAALSDALARAERAVRVDGADPVAALTAFFEPVADDPDNVDAGSDDTPAEDVALFWLATVARERGGRTAPSPDRSTNSRRTTPRWKIVVGTVVGAWAAFLGLAAAVARDADSFAAFLVAGVVPLGVFFAVATKGRTRIVWAVAILALLRIGAAVLSVAHAPLRHR